MIEAAFLFALVAMFAWGIADTVAHGPAHRIKPEVIVLQQNVVTFCILLVPSFFLWSLFSWGWPIVIPLLAGVAGSLGFLSFIISLNGGKVGISTAIGNSFPLFTALFGILVLGETLPLLALVAIVSIVVGVIVMSVNLSDWRESHIFSSESTQRFAFAALFFWTLFSILMKLGSDYVVPLQAALLIEVGALVTITAVFFMRKATIADLKAVSKRDRYLIFVIGTLLGIGTLSINTAYGLGSLSIVSAIIGAMPLVTAILAYLFLHERMNRKEWLAALVIVAGLIALGYFGNV